MPIPPRSSAARRGYGWRWRNPNGTGAADIFLRANPLCVDCQKAGLLTPATVVDHVRPHRGDYGAFWDETNWQSLCVPCHNAKTARGE